MRFRAVFDGVDWWDDAVVDAEGVRAARAGDPPAIDGLAMPGLVNAHAHLEHSHGLVESGDGLTAWIRRLGPPSGAAEAARSAAALGTAAICDISNAGDTVEAIRAAGMAGVVQHERLGLDRTWIAPQIAALYGGQWGDVALRPAPHGVYSTSPATIRATVAWESPHPASIHAAEHEDEMVFLRDGSGPFAALLDELGRDWRWWVPPGISPIAFLARLEVLDRVLVVHGVHLDDADRALLSGGWLCLCPRSNLHLGGQLPDVPALLDAGVGLCLGTDSLASTPDLDLLAEARTLAEAFPSVPPIAWLRMATSGGAAALRFPRHGRIAPGAPLLLLEGVGTPEEALRAGPRRWIAAPGGVA